MLKDSVDIKEIERAHLRLACRMRVKNETHKDVVFILVGSCGTSGQRKCAINESVVVTYPLIIVELKKTVDIEVQTKECIYV